MLIDAASDSRRPREAKNAIREFVDLYRNEIDREAGQIFEEFLGRGEGPFEPGGSGGPFEPGPFEPGGHGGHDGFEP
jgi:hypothetical protein